MTTPLSPTETGKQLRKPDGEAGIAIGRDMNRSNRQMYTDLFALLTLNDLDTVLEIGYGNGMHFPGYLVSGKAITLYGMDYSKVMHQEAMQNNASFVAIGSIIPEYGDIIACSYPDNKFDHIIALNTVYFWEPLEDYLSVLFRILKPGGKLYLGYRPKRVLHQVDFVQEGFALYEEAVLNDQLEKAGFEIIQEHQHNYTKMTVNDQPLESTDLVTVCIKKEA
ncbi:methyltransferase domain-containing protein [Flavobacterium supellecticarium]|uniref:Methyltransferase domain-containing protein n=1 Tax=Flavobacterium supellecticarium TaxID=2565924 RepID=A0A4S4A3E7_9FLAO|nr:methyltransferase domain-containing protein [Flavobacterium supellecticarium]THF52808.1 methyltransferase domain-containing protein [Flavobacterium supellecticarium]